MTIDMHAHWFPETLADAFRKRTSKPRIYTKEDGKAKNPSFDKSRPEPPKAALPLEPSQLSR